jgi:hypothetical protein
MSEFKQIPEFKSYEEMAGFWDTHSLVDYWDQTEPAEFEISEQARRRYLRLFCNCCKKTSGAMRTQTAGACPPVVSADRWGMSGRSGCDETSSASAKAR